MDLGKDRKAGEPIRYCFRNLQHSRDTSGQVQMKKVVETLDEDGFPPVGTLLKQGDPVYTVLDMVTNKVRIAKHKDSEPAYVEEIRLLGNDGVKAGILQKVAIKFRYNRNPVVGDKFSSRHGQKGVLSILWPQEVSGAGLLMQRSSSVTSHVCFVFACTPCCCYCCRICPSRSRAFPLMS